MAMDRTVLCGSKCTGSASAFRLTLAAFPNTTTATNSRPPKPVFLHDWWLVKVNGKGIAVKGFAYKDDQSVSLFCSAVVVKRHDTTTIEAADGVIILISGLINAVQAYESGFPREVIDRFLLGFPYDWEEYAMRYSLDYPSKNELLAPSLDACRFRRIRDLLSASSAEGNNLLMRNICDEILRKAGESVPDQNESLYLPDILNTCLGTATYRSCQLQQKVDNIKNDSNGEKESNGLTEAKVITNEVITPRRGMLTRSMRRKKLNCGEKENCTFQALP